jgi:hypothetical protein
MGALSENFKQLSSYVPQCAAIFPLDVFVLPQNLSESLDFGRRGGRKPGFFQHGLESRPSDLKPNQISTLDLKYCQILGPSKNCLPGESGPAIAADKQCSRAPVSQYEVEMRSKQ